jgi:DNA repair exonuclease SbcCD nuclease subunit
LKLLHAADLHIDSPLRGLDRYPGAPVARIRGATRAALSGLVDFCLEAKVDALLLAGDLYDGDWPDYATGLFFCKEMSRLRAADVRVYSVRGNHDAQNKMTKRLRLPENVVELSTKAPETFHDDRLGLAVHGQGFPTRDVKDDLSAGYPPPLPGYFNVGLLHTSLTGRPGHDDYAPCSVASLVDKGYSYWALGHVHTREVVHQAPYVVFPGNLQGRHARETGAKGATLVEVASGEVAALTHVPLDVLRWAAVEVDVTAARNTDDALEAARAALERAIDEADGRLVCARVHLVGESACHAALAGDPEAVESQIRAVANDFIDSLFVEKVVIGTRARVDRAALRRRDDALGQLLVGLDALGDDPVALAALATELEDLGKKLPREAKQGPDALRLDDPGFVREVLDEVEALLLPRLLPLDGKEEA